MALLRSSPRYLLDTEAYLLDEAFNDPTGLLSDAATAAPAPAAADPVVAATTAPVAASGWTPWTDMVNANQIGDYYYMPNTELIPEWVGGGQRLTGLTRYKMSDWQKTQDPYNQRTEDPYATNFVPYELVDPATGQVIGGVTKPEYTTGWQPGQAWDPTWKNPALVGGDLYAPRYEEDPYSPGQQKLAGLIRYVGGKKPAPGQTGYVQDLDVTGRGSSPVTTLTPYLVNPRGNIFFEALTGALPMLAPIGAYAMGLGAAGAAGAAGDAAGFIGEGVASGVPAWDAAAINAGVPLTGAPATLADLYEPPPPTDMLDIASRPNVPDPYANETSKLLRQQTIAQDTPGGGLANMSGSGAVVPSASINTPTSLLDAIKSGSVLDYLKANPETGRALFSAAGALLNTSGGSGGGAGSGAGGYVDSGYRPTISREGFSAAPQARQMPLSPVGLLSAPTRGQAMSGLWRYGLLGG